MNKSHQHTRSSDAIHPTATPFHVFVQQQAALGKVVDRVAARRWVMSSYKREALIRIGAQNIASTSLRLEVRKQRATDKNSLTVAAIGFTRNGESINDVDSEAFYSRGIAVVFQRLVTARSQTYAYDKEEAAFRPVGVTVPPKVKKNIGTVKAIFGVLSARNATASEIAVAHNVNVDSVRSILSRFFIQGRVCKVERTKPGKGEVIWGIAQEVGASSV